MSEEAVEEIQTTEPTTTEAPQPTTEAPVETEATAPAEATPEETTPEPVADVPIPDWMRSVLAPQTPASEERPQEKDIPPEFLQDTVFDDETKSVLFAEMNKMIQGVKEETRETAGKFKAQERQQAERAVNDTMHNVHQNLYNDQFRNDPTFQGNKEAAEKLDLTVQNFIKNAAIEAVEYGDYKSLKMANDPKFGPVVSAMVKAAMGITDGPSKAINVKGAEVESGTAASAGDGSTTNLTANQRKIMKEYGISEKDIIEAEKIRGSDYSDYNAE